jgi:3-oxoacyl-[acyl-carrier-protein] synthase II
MEEPRRSGAGHLSTPSPIKKRIVITGIGAVSPMGPSARDSFANVLAAKHAIQTIKSFSAEALPVQIACEVGAWFEPNKRFGKRHADQMDRFAHFASASALDAWEDAKVKGHYDSERAAVVMASGLGGILSVLQAADALREHGPRRVSPFTVPRVLPSIGAGWVSILLGLRGPNLSPATACAAGAHAIIQGAQLLQYGEADVAIVGGAEAPICAVGIAAFAAMRALSTTACKPFSLERDGFVLGEGGAALVLEEREAAQARGATIYAELAGFGQSGDGFHLTAPSEEGDGCLRAMKQALQRAGVTPEEVEYINAHATGTKAGDLAEARAIYELFGERVWVSSTKGATGHLLGAAGALEAVFSVLALQQRQLPPNLFADTLDPACQVLVATSSQPIKRDYALSNSMGFGGTNASLLFKKS